MFVSKKTELERSYAIYIRSLAVDVKLEKETHTHTHTHTLERRKVLQWKEFTWLGCALPKRDFAFASLRSVKPHISA